MTSTVEPRSNIILISVWGVGVFLTVFPALVSLVVNLGQDVGETNVALVRDLLFASSALAGVAIAEASGGFFTYLDQGRKTQCAAAFVTIMVLLVALVVCLSAFGLIVSKNPILLSRIALTIWVTVFVLLIVLYLSYTLKTSLSCDAGAIYVEQAINRLSSKQEASPEMQGARQ